jgi:hypothetical protein
MMLAQAAALAATIAVNDAVPVQSVSSNKLRNNLEASGLAYEWHSTGETDETTWTTAELLEADAGVSPDGTSVLQQLQEAGIVEDVQRWQPVFESREPCPANLTSELLIRGAGKLAGASDVDTAIDILKANGVIVDPEYWRERIQTDRPVPAQWIIDFSKKLLKILSGR